MTSRGTWNTSYGNGRPRCGSTAPTAEIEGAKTAAAQGPEGGPLRSHSSRRAVRAKSNTASGPLMEIEAGDRADAARGQPSARRAKGLIGFPQGSVIRKGMAGGPLLRLGEGGRTPYNTRHVPTSSRP